MKHPPASIDFSLLNPRDEAGEWERLVARVLHHAAAASPAAPGTTARAERPISTTTGPA